MSDFNMCFSECQFSALKKKTSLFKTKGGRVYKFLPTRRTFNLCGLRKLWGYGNDEVVDDSLNLNFSSEEFLETSSRWLKKWSSVGESSSECSEWNRILHPTPFNFYSICRLVVARCRWRQSLRPILSGDAEIFGAHRRFFRRLSRCSHLFGVKEAVVDSHRWWARLSFDQFQFRKVLRGFTIEQSLRQSSLVFVEYLFFVGRYNALKKQVVLAVQKERGRHLKMATSLIFVQSLLRPFVELLQLCNVL